MITVKKNLRVTMKSLRFQHVNTNQIDSKNICAKVLSIIPHNSKVACYLSFNGEVDTLEMIEELQRYHEVFTPKIIGDIMVMNRFEGFDKLAVNQYGIMESQSDTIIKPENLDYVIIPMLAFDKEGHRLGYGGGYYDRYLNNTNATRIGIAFQYQYVKESFSEDFDVKCHLIVTDREVIYFNVE